MLRDWLHTWNHRLMPALLGAIVLFALGRWAWHLETPVRDWFLRSAAKPATQSAVSLVLIDDVSLERLHERFGAPPWSREAYLTLFQKILSYDPALLEATKASTRT